MKRPNAQLQGFERDLTQPHGTIQQKWWLTEGGHIAQRGPVGLARVVKPSLSSFVKVVRTAHETYQDEIEVASWIFDVPRPMLLATIVAESGGRPKSKRYESHLKDSSFGLGQILTSTATAIAHRVDWNYDAPDNLLPRRSIPVGGNAAQWEKALTDPIHNISLVGAFYHLQNGDNPQWFNDPITLYASYNAGGAYESTNAWGLHCAPAAIDSFRNSYNLAVDAIKGTE